MKLTLSVIKADIGSLVGHSVVHPDIESMAKIHLGRDKDIEDFYVTHCGDDLELIMTHRKGVNNKKICKLAWDIFMKAAERAKKMGLYGAGQDLLTKSFSGNIRGMGPGVAEMEFKERASDPVVIFMADKTEAGAWNHPLYKIFADPFNTAGLVIDPKLHKGFKFEILDVINHKKILLNSPEENHDILALIGAPSRYVVKSIFRKDGEIAATSSTEKLSKLAGRYVGKDDPVCIVRAQSGFPAVGEVLEPFAFPFMVAGWMRGSHHGPFMPVGEKNAKCTRFDGPPRVIGLGFQLNNGKLLGPNDMFDDPGFDRARQEANRMADYIRKHGPFEPHRLPQDDMEYTTLPEVLKKLKGRFKKI
jgi:fructose 1,6-bisphosphate aldolase/phosphatase